MEYGQYPELAPREASCGNCAKGYNGKNCCPVTGKVAKCAAYERLKEADKPTPPEQIKLPVSLKKFSALVPSLVPEDIAVLAARILQTWEFQLGDGTFDKYAIVNRRNPALKASFDRFHARAAEILGHPLAEDPEYVLWSLMMLGAGARKEYACYCDRAQLQHEMSKKAGGTNETK